VLLCYVIYDSSTTNVDLVTKTPMCIKEMHVMEVFVNRWVPNENRDQQQINAIQNNNNTSTSIV
jgi:hypothetical protein